MGIRPSVAALQVFSRTVGLRGGPLSSGGADDGLLVCVVLGWTYADTTDRSTVLPMFTLSPVSTSVSSAPIRESTFILNCGRRVELL